MRNLQWLGLILAVAILPPSVQTAEALPLTPESGPLGVYSGYITPPSTGAIEAAADLICNCTSNGLYKYDAGGGESGSLSGSYTAVLWPTGDESGGSITFDNSGQDISNGWLLVKDGNANPNWYLFDLSYFKWNGTDTISLSGFWDGTKGSISHVALYGTAVPEPATLSLLAVAFVGIGLARRRTQPL